MFEFAPSPSSPSHPSYSVQFKPLNLKEDLDVDALDNNDDHYGGDVVHNKINHSIVKIIPKLIFIR